VIFLPLRPGGTGSVQVVSVDPRELDAAQAKDVATDNGRPHNQP